MECKSIIKEILFSLMLAVMCIGLAVLAPISAAAEDSTIVTTRTIASDNEWTAFVLDFTTADASTVWNITLATNISADSSITGNAFLGTFDGGGNTITLTGLSLFDAAGGDSTETVIQNVILEGTATSSSTVGGLVNTAKGVTFTNCSNSGSITGSGDYTGGLVGSATNCSFTNCSNSGSITGSGDCTGGLIGEAAGVTITQCYNLATLAANTYAGGIVGCNFASGVSISNSYNLGDIKANSGAGGMVGRAEASMTLTNVYSAAVMEEGSGYHSELIGSIASDSSASITYSTAYLIDVLDKGSSSDGATIVTLTELQETFSGVSGWSVMAGLYPVLSYQSADTTVDYLLYAVPAMIIGDYLVKGEYPGYTWSGTTLTSTAGSKRVLNEQYEQYSGTVVTMYVADGTSSYSHAASTAYCMPIGMQSVQTSTGETDGCNYAEQAIFYVAKDANYQYIA